MPTLYRLDFEWLSLISLGGVKPYYLWYLAMHESIRSLIYTKMFFSYGYCSQPYIRIVDIPNLKLAQLTNPSIEYLPGNILEALLDDDSLTHMTGIRITGQCHWDIDISGKSHRFSVGISLHETPKRHLHRCIFCWSTPFHVCSLQSYDMVIHWRMPQAYEEWKQKKMQKK